VRYARQSDEGRRCDECTRLAAEHAALYQEYLDARDALTLTAKTDPDYSSRAKCLTKLRGQLREALKRDQLHEETHPLPANVDPSYERASRYMWKPRQS
jgi:hypothetical protein